MTKDLSENAPVCVYRCQLSLNLDILVYVMPFIRSRRDLVSFISTCYDLYRAGVPILLGLHHTITARNLASFFKFLTSKSPSSFLKLRSLSLYFPPYPEGIESGGINMVTNILSGARKLQHVVVHGSIMERDPAAYRALAALTALTSLNLALCHDAMDEQSTVLKQLQSPLKSINVAIPGKEDDMIGALSNFSLTLENAVVVLLPKSHLSHAIGPSTSNYLNLQYLGLDSSTSISPKLSILLPAFPNLKHLIVKGSDDFDGFEIEQTRKDNRRFQETNPGQTWSLSSLTGAVRSLYALGLQTGVPIVIITRVASDMDSEAERLQEVLTPLHPQQLSFEGIEEPILEPDWLSSVITYDWHDLVRLSLVLAFDNSDPFNDFQGPLVSIILSYVHYLLAILNLRHIGPSFR